MLLILVELAGASAVSSAAFGATCGALAGYAGNRRFTFSSRAPHGQALPRFAAVAAFGAIASGSIVLAGTELLRLHYLVAQLIATALILWTGFVLNRRWTFS
jgi:putative flippase GtrA